MTTMTDVQAMVADIQRRWEEANAARDFEAISALFTENGVYLPAPGGIAEGRQEIRSVLERDAAPAVKIRSSRLDMLGGNMLLDIGTFTLTLPEEAGGTFEGEYVSLSEIGEDKLRIRSLTTFPMRQPLSTADQT